MQEKHKNTPLIGDKVAVAFQFNEYARRLKIDLTLTPGASKRYAKLCYMALLAEHNKVKLPAGDPHGPQRLISTAWIAEQIKGAWSVADAR